MASVDVMTGVVFEQFCRWLFEGQDVLIEMTPATGDRGADLIVTRGGERTAVQAKRHSLASRVSSDAVREVITARNHYSTQKALVITNAYFTKQAQETATENDVELWDREILAGRLAGARERDAGGKREDPALARMRKKLEAPMFEFRGVIEQIGAASISSSATSDLGLVESALSSLSRLAHDVGTKLIDLDSAAEALLDAYVPDNARQAYRLSVSEPAAAQLITGLLTITEILQSAVAAFVRERAPLKYGSAQHAQEFIRAVASAARAIADRIDAAGLEREGVLILVRREGAMQAAAMERERQIGIARQKAAKLEELVQKARTTSNNKISRESNRSYRGRW